MRNTAPVVLKVSKHSSDEWNSGSILRAFDDDGAVGVFEFEPGAVLLERLIPGNDLVKMVREGNDETATQILGEVMGKMSNHTPPDSCPTILDWARGFDRYLKTNDSQVPAGLVHEAHQLFRNLATSSTRTMLLHGDLHHYNILFDAHRGWLAIDPKGVVGELEYEVGAIIRNPIELPDVFLSPEVIERRLRTITDALQLDYQRALQWAFAQAVLSAIWSVEDGERVEPDHPVLNLARTLKQMLS